MKNNDYKPKNGLFKRNQEKKYLKNTDKKNKIQPVNQPSNQKIKNENIINENSTNVSYQRQLSEVDKVYLQHMQVIKNEIGKLIADVQYLDSKNPVVSSDMKKIIVELIINAWKIGNIVTTLKEENELTIVSKLLSEYEKRYLKNINDSNGNSSTINELKSIKMCQNIIKNSLHQINSTVEYYNILMSKLSDWGFEVKNPVGQMYDVHMDIDILAFEDCDPNLKVPVITETKKPEIYLNGNKLARAQVIVRKAGGKKNRMHKKR